MPQPPDPRPSRDDLTEVAREVLPRPSPTLIRATLRFLGRLVATTGALGVAVVAIPGVDLRGGGHPWPSDVAALVLLVAVPAAAMAPLFARLAGRMAGLWFGLSAFVLDLALLRAADVLMAEGFYVVGTVGWLGAAALLAVPTATFAVIGDVLRQPDTVELPRDDD